MYSEKATKFFKIFTLLLTACTVVKRKVKISQNFVAFSEYMNFNINLEKNGMPEQSSVHFFGLRLSLLANFPGATSMSIPGCMSILESRVYSKLYSFNSKI